MGQNHSSPNSPRHHPDYYPRHAHRDHHSVLDYPKRNDAPKSSSFVNNVPPSTKICSCRGKGLSCHNVLSSFNEENEVRVSSTTNKSKGSSTIKSYNTSQEPRKSEDFDMGQMDENADLRKKRASFLENHGYLDSGLISNEILSKIGMKAEPLPYKDRISIMSSYQNHSPLGNKDSRLEISTIGPHFMERETHRLEEKEGDDDAGIIMKTEVCEKEEEPYEIKYKDRMDSPLCMMESMEFKRERIIRDKDDEVILHDSNGSSPNRPARHYIGYPASNKVVDYTRGFRRPDLTASFEEDQLEPNLVKDLDMVSLHSDDVNVPEIKSPNRGYQGFSPKKMHKNNRILERRDGTYQEVEFSFKPNTLSKGSQRYTSEEENATAAKRESLDSIENPLSEQKDGLEIDINLAQHSPKFINSPLSSNQVRFGTASSKSSAVCNKNSPRISPHNRDIGLVQALNTGYTNLASPKELFTDEVMTDLKPKEPLKPSHYIGDTDIGRIAKKHSRDLPFMPPSSRIMTPLNDSKNTQHISPLNQNILPLNYLNTGNFYEKGHCRQISKENKPTLDMAVIQGVTKLDTKKPQTTRSNHKVVRSHIPDNILKDIHKRDIRRGSNPLNSPALRQNQLFPQFQSFSKESEGSYSATRILKEHNILKKISNQATNMSKDSKRSSASLKQNNIKNKNQRLKFGHANTFIEQPPESFYLDDSIARLERRKQSIINDLKSNKATVPADYYRVQIKDTYCVSPMVGGNHSFVYPVQSVRNSSKMQVEVECEVAAKDLIAGTPAGLDSRAPVQAKPRSTVRQHSKLCRNCRENQENRARSSREENAVITNRYAYSHQVSPTRDDCQFEHTAEMLASKKVSLERKNVLKDSKKSSKDKNSKIQLYLNSTAELPERPFSRLTPNRMQGEIEPIFRAEPIIQLERKRKDNPRKTLMQHRF